MQLSPTAPAPTTTWQVLQPSPAPPSVMPVRTHDKQLPYDFLDTTVRATAPRPDAELYANSASVDFRPYYGYWTLGSEKDVPFEDAVRGAATLMRGDMPRESLALGRSGGQWIALDLCGFGGTLDDDYAELGNWAKVEVAGSRKPIDAVLATYDGMMLLTDTRK